MDFLKNESGADFNISENTNDFLDIVAPRIFNNGDDDENGGNNTGGGSGVTPPVGDEDDDDNTGPKPFPDSPRSRESAHQINIYALLVGINEYHDEEINLKGCLEDTKMVEEYLRRRFAPDSTPISYTIEETSEGNQFRADTDVQTLDDSADLPMSSDGRLHVCVLRNEQATYDNIIKGFHTLRDKITGEDSFFFHFSGHGTEQFTADEFADFRVDGAGKKTIAPIVPDGKDQALVCFKNSDERPFFLRDKELAKLIHEIENNPRTSATKKPHIVISLDACHSGSGTREFTTATTSGINSGNLSSNGGGRQDLGTALVTPPNHSEDVGIDFSPRFYDPQSVATRNAAEPGFGPGQKGVLSKYYGNYKADNLEIPTSRHILLSACESQQLAGDSSRGGIYTTSLIETLNQAMKQGKELHYGNLFTLSRSTARQVQKRKQLTNEQTPQLDSLGGFDPYTSFLEGWPLGTPGRYEMFHENDQWFVRAGAVHSLPQNGEGKIKVQIFDAIDSANHVANGRILNVGAQHSSVKLLDGEVTIPTDGKYVAEILSLPAKPIYLQLTGAEEDINQLKNASNWSSLEAKNILVLSEEEATAGMKARIEVNIRQRDILFSDLETGLNFGVLDKLDIGNHFAETVEVLHKLGTWIRLIQLENKNSPIKNLYSANLVLTDNSEVTSNHSQGDIKLSVNEELHSYQSVYYAIETNIEVEMDAVPQDLFFYSFILDRNGAITFFNDEEQNGKVQFDADNIERSVTRLLRSKGEMAGMEKTDRTSTVWFKVFVTTEEMDYQFLQQKGLGENRIISLGPRRPEKFSNQWDVQTFKLTFEKE